HGHGRGVDGAPSQPQQPDGAHLGGHADQAADGGLLRPRRRPPGVRGGQPAALAPPVGHPAGNPAGPAGPGGARAGARAPARRPLPYSDPAHQAAHQFLVEEAALLDAADYAGWLALLCEDIRYRMPVRVTTARGAGFDSLDGMAHFDENMYALRKRVERLAT